MRKGRESDKGAFSAYRSVFRVMSTEYIKLYPGTKEMLKELKKAGKNVYLLSNAQRIFTAYEMRRLDIFDLFDDVFISSDYNTKSLISDFIRS